ncbi:MAG TPA: ABC transporter permease [Acidimicrobiales bacterium]|nr:ABC transporter permease [Acidimicrobiales bacterium]
MMPVVARRLLVLIPTWLGLSLFAFALSTLSPGDPAELILNRELNEPATPEQLAEFRERHGLDNTFVVQYANFVADSLRGKFGVSFRSGKSVRDELWNRMGPTLQIALPAFATSVLVAVAFGVLAALRRNSLGDHVSRAVALIFESMPSFALAYLLIIVLAIKAGWFPVAGKGGPEYMVLPVLTLTLATLATTMRLTRSSLLDVLAAPYIRTARAMGVRSRRVVLTLALRNALIPVVTVAGLILAGFVTGTVIVETVFAWPGIGQYVVDAVFARDYPVVTGFVIFTGTVFVLVNLVVDLLYTRLDPRVRLGHAGGNA